MEEQLQDKPGLFGRLATIFARTEEVEDEDDTDGRPANSLAIKTAHRYTVTVRRQIVSFDDAVAAAIGLKRGEQQVLNLAGTDPAIRQKIVDFMCGVSFAQEGAWEELGENIYMVVPASAYVEVAPATPRMNAVRN